jgi:DNA polymerase-4
MDRLNLKYGHTTLHFGSMLPARKSAPTQIAFTKSPCSTAQIIYELIYEEF